MRWLASIYRAARGPDGSRYPSSKRIVIVILIIGCLVIVLLEEWLTDNQLSISSKPSNENLNNIVDPAKSNQANSPEHVNITGDRCWLTESYEVVKPCSLCATYELEINHSSYRSNIKICSRTGFKELIECSKSGPVERACHTNWRQFLKFLSLVSMFGGITGLLIKYRLHKLRDRSLARFRKQSDSDDSHHTLIDMGWAAIVWCGRASRCFYKWYR